MAQSLTEILSADDIARLEPGYDGGMVGKAAEAAFAGPYAPAGDFAKVITAQFYAPREGVEQMTARDREIAMLALFADVPDMNFMTHVYIALMEGLSPALIVNTVYLATLYRGAGLWPEASRVLGETFTKLKAAADKGGDAVGMRAVLGALRG